MDIERNPPNEDTETNQRPASSEIAVRTVNPKGNSDTTEASEGAAKRKAMTVFEVWMVILTISAILVAGLTGVVPWLTLIEIRNGAGDTYTLAQAAKRQADKAETISASIQQAADEMKITNSQAKDALDKTLRQSKQVLDASIVNSRLDQRAWVGAIAISKPELAVRKDFSASIEVANTGKTPAVKFSSLAQFQWVGNGAHLSPFYMVSGIPGSVSVVQPGMHASINTPQIPITEAQFEAIKEGKLRLYVYGILKYEDIFGKPHMNKFCGYFSSQDMKFATSCDTYNEAN